MLSEYDRKVLRACDGEDVGDLIWGAAMGETIEYLCGTGHLERQFTTSGIVYVTTPAGRQALEESDG